MGNQESFIYEPNNPAHYNCLAGIFCAGINFEGVNFIVMPEMPTYGMEVGDGNGATNIYSIDAADFNGSAGFSLRLPSNAQVGNKLEATVRGQKVTVQVYGENRARVVS